MSNAYALLGDIATLQAGFGFPPSLQGRTNGQYPFAKVGDISRGGRSESSILSNADHYIDADDVAALRAKIVPPGSILFAKIGEAIRQNHRVVAGCEMLIDNNAMAAIPTARVASRFLYHYLKTVDFYCLAPATTVPALRKSDLAKLKVPLPPLPEQRRIAAILDQADALRAKRREALAQLDSLTQSVFIEMFGDEVTNSKALSKRPLGDLIQVKSGDFLPASAMSPEGKIPVFGGNGVNGFHNVSMFERPKIVIGRVGAYCGCVHTTPAESWVTDNALYVSKVDASLQFDYLAFALRRANLNRVASQSGQPLVSASRIYPVEILVPTMDSQLTFAIRIQAVETLKTINRATLAELDALFASLQHRAFAGQLS